MDDLLKRYSAAKKAELLALLTLVLCIFGMGEIMTQFFTALHGEFHLGITPGEKHALFFCEGVGAVAAIALWIATFKFVHPLEDAIYRESLRQEVDAKIKAEAAKFAAEIDAKVADAIALDNARREWIRQKAIYAARRRERQRRGK